MVVALGALTWDVGESLDAELGCCCDGLQVYCHLPLPLAPAVLAPDQHPCLVQLQGGSQASSLCAGQVAFEVKGQLQLWL